MKVTYIELLGERHPLCFSLAASEALDESFGGLDRMTQALSSGSLSQTAKAVDTVLQILMKAGRVYCGARGDELPPPLPCRPADLLEPELEKYKAEFKDLAKSEEDVLSLALFPQVAPKFLAWRDGPRDEAPAAPAAKPAASSNGVRELYVDDKSL